MSGFFPAYQNDHIFMFIHKEIQPPSVASHFQPIEHTRPTLIALSKSHIRPVIDPVPKIVNFFFLSDAPIFPKLIRKNDPRALRLY